MNMRNAHRAAGIFAAAMFVSSCAVFDGTKRLKDPATVDVLDPKAGIVSQAITSDRRLVIYRDNKICLEPPPDTASNISASYSGALDASLKAASQETAPDIKASYADQLATALNHITNPSQGTLFMRYAMAAACNAYMNDAIGKDQYFQFITSAFNASVAMTMFELDKNGGKVGGNVSAVTQNALTLSGAVVSVAAAQKAANDAVTTNASSAGKPAANAAGKQASDVVKQQAPADTTVEGLAATSGQAAHDAVLDITKDPSKASKARVDAIKKVFTLASIAATAPDKMQLGSVSGSSSPSFQAALAEATAPLTNLNVEYGLDGRGGIAVSAERSGFKALLNRDMPSALKAFDEAYAAFPTFHNVDEIRKLLQLKYSKLSPKDEDRWQELYSTIVKQHSWLGPSDLLQQMKKKADHN